MSLFQVGKEPGPIFHILVYDLAYINVPNIRVWSDAQFKQNLKSLRSGLKIKENEKLCPNKVVNTDKEIVCDYESANFPEKILDAIDDAIEYCVAKQCKDKEYPDTIETIILSRIYTYMVPPESKNYSWHVFVSEVHDPNQA